jgi:hypothetical protein
VEIMELHDGKVFMDVGRLLFVIAHELKVGYFLVKVLVQRLKATLTPIETDDCAIFPCKVLECNPAFLIPKLVS